MSVWIINSRQKRSCGVLLPITTISLKRGGTLIVLAFIREHTKARRILLTARPSHLVPV